MEFCPHEVFEEKDGKPSVKNPENCVEFCRGCQKGACDNNAISYFGE
jgi:NAD-dependent dihydropyrimidine dehydrogenase PreA subunit